MVGEHRCQLFLRKVRALLALPHRTPPPLQFSYLERRIYGNLDRRCLEVEANCTADAHLPRYDPGDGAHNYCRGSCDSVCYRFRQEKARDKEQHKHYLLSCRHQWRHDDSLCSSCQKDRTSKTYSGLAIAAGQSSVSSRRRCARSRQNAPKS